jgi:ribosome biogenesis GTPase
MAGKKRKIRVAFRKNRQNRARSNDLTRESEQSGEDASSHAGSERMTGKGDLTRYRTVVVDEGSTGELRREISLTECREGRVLSAIGLNSLVQDALGETFECSVRRVVRTLARDARNAVVTGDRVLFRPSGSRSESGLPQGVVERVEPRTGVVSRQQDSREHILAANVDQAAIVASADEPPLKPSLIDRFIVSCEKGNVEPLVCINKADLVRTGSLDRLVYVYASLGYRVLPTSTVDGRGVEELRSLLAGKTTVFTGQSGVGKSSLLNTTQPSLDLKTGDVSDWSLKGRHTTRRAVLLPLEGGGYVIDTPGIRQFQLWEVDAAEMEGYFAEFVRYVPQCRFPDCGHTHEEGCAVKRAVSLGLITSGRYESYLRLIADEDD